MTVVEHLNPDSRKSIQPTPRHILTFSYPLGRPLFQSSAIIGQGHFGKRDVFRKYVIPSAAIAPDIREPEDAFVLPTMFVNEILWIDP